MPAHLVLGTHNPNKADELAALLAPVGVEVATLVEAGNAIDVVEDGDSFQENARKKAREQAVHLQQWVLAEDSGLCVDVLGGEPGIFSARFAGETASDTENNCRLLTALSKIPFPQRTAHYACCMALCDPAGIVRAESRGVCGGRIRLEEFGTNGFGYDPLFEVIEYHRTFGELAPVVKSAISHRARAMRAIVPQIAALLAEATMCT